MGGFMNAELEAIRDNLVCGHCQSIFKGTDSQARKMKYEKLIVYCTSACRSAAHSIKASEQAIREGKTPRKGALFGPCPTCHQMFESRYDKLFCSLSCYNKSPQFVEQARAQLAKLNTPEIRAAQGLARRTGQDMPCEECGKEFYQKPSASHNKAKRFCCRPCFRSWMAKRFDRWVANPQRLALLQCYDEFLDQDELPCLIDGCDWAGKHLSIHMNQAHGIAAEEFKRAAGFNLGTGVISRSLAKVLSARETVGVGIAGVYREAIQEKSLMEIASMKINKVQRYMSMERRERASKVRLLAMAEPGPQRTCHGCGCPFQQSTIFGKAKYCTKDCRQKAYAQRQPKAKQRIRIGDGTFRWIDVAQDDRSRQ